MQLSNNTSFWLKSGDPEEPLSCKSKIPTISITHGMPLMSQTLVPLAHPSSRIIISTNFHDVPIGMVDAYLQRGVESPGPNPQRLRPKNPGMSL